MGLEIPSMSQTCCFVICGHWGETKNRSTFSGAGGCAWCGRCAWTAARLSRGSPWPRGGVRTPLSFRCWWCFGSLAGEISPVRAGGERENPSSQDPL